MRVERYTSDQRILWDECIRNSTNGTFLHYRGYMEYHADRFEDHSLLFFDGSKPVAVLPANEDQDELISHGGLTYGGLISDHKAKASTMLTVVAALLFYLKDHGLTRLVYKAVPHIYHKVPSEEDLYALFFHKAHLFRRDVSSTVLLSDKPPYSKGRRWAVKKSHTGGLMVRRSYDFATFMRIETETLLKHGVRPTHTAKEIQLLADRFPDNIKLFAAFQNESLVAGVLVYETERVAHAQYIGATEEGWNAHGTDLILDYLLCDYYAEKAYFDFGISTEEGGRYLNEGLIQNKESYGARAVMYDFYELELGT